jgi:streptomycin 6-kinase
LSPIVLDQYLSRWDLTPDGDPIVTPTSTLMPVRQHSTPAMLKIATHREEIVGNRLMVWLDGQGAARVLAHEGNTVLLERAIGARSLADLAGSERDDEASRIICGVVAQLHAVRKKPPPDLVPLTQWFRELPPAAAAKGGILVRCAEVARELLATPADIVVLHGDIHHDNVLDFAERGWRAIDPQGLIGERGFDYANIFCNPDHETAAAPGRLDRQVDIVAAAAGLERTRLLKWIVAWAGLSAVWSISEGELPDTALEIAERATAVLNE